MKAEGARPDFSNIPNETIKEFHRQGEVCLQGTVQLAIAADQRATTLTGTLGAAAVALMVATGALVSNPSLLPDTALVYATLVTALMLFVGAILCAMVARSTDFFVAGYEPKNLAKSAANELWMLRYAAEDVQVRIDGNRRTLDASSRMLTWGRGMAVAALPVGAAIFLLAYAAKGGLHLF